jgi:hypothetical protein
MRHVRFIEFGQRDALIPGVRRFVFLDANDFFESQSVSLLELISHIRLNAYIAGYRTDFIIPNEASSGNRRPGMDRDRPGRARI